MRITLFVGFLLSAVSAFQFEEFKQDIKQLSENEICDVRGSKPWTCQRADRCPHFTTDLKRGIRPRVCGFNGSYTIVCCNMRPSQGWCHHYEKQTWHFCPQLYFVIFGGEESSSKEFPHMALIGYGSQRDIVWQCGGSIISDQYVLSAAHCTDPGGQVGPARWVRLGDLDLSTDKDDAKPEDFRIVEAINHPKYDPVTLYNDIALFKLDKKVMFNDYIMPACLFQTQEIDSDIAIVTGWGRLDFAGPTSKHLMKATVSLFSNDDCRSLTGNNALLPRGIDSSSQLCAGEMDGSADTCQGDSGGPLTLSGRACLAYQVGITSFGKQCALLESPGVYTRVSNYIPWIESIVWP